MYIKETDTFNVYCIYSNSLLMSVSFLHHWMTVPSCLVTARSANNLTTIPTSCNPPTYSVRCSDPVLSHQIIHYPAMSPLVSLTADLFHWVYFHELRLINNRVRISVTNLAWEHVTLNIVTVIFKHGKLFMFIHSCLTVYDAWEL